MDNYLERELRSDHAGETGAVFIYRGIAAVAKISNDSELRSLAKHHGATEEAHLQLIESVLANNLRSRLLALWRIAGWLIGAVPAMFGRRAVYATVMAVETFVEQHYQSQINYLMETGTSPDLLALLRRCQADEIAHKNEAKAMVLAALPLALRIWCAVVRWGSSSAVMVARQI
jgi:ubiquinone biosynthesis monooxygenase Coq7